ncbi:hypothetical protein AA309_24100 [Microvirga vignae]|uniref:Uncharacterized protein n=2 Tax=Microvirga vignae TaxID=1225564 RepID=A0A0H1R6B3_9HYPH|nr:hypothetical protein AA309_24100 [Microvirga vignae]
MMGAGSEKGPIDVLNVSETWKKRFRIIEKAGNIGAFGYRNGSQLDLSERFSVGFSVLAFFFGPFYYFFKGMHQKGFVLLGSGFLFSFVFALVEILINKTLPPFLYYIPTAALCASLASYDYYMFKVKLVTMWEPFRPFRQVWVAATFALACLVLPIATLTLGEKALSNFQMGSISFDGILPGGDLQAEFSGVWRDDEGTIVEISLDNEVKQITIAQQTVQVQIRKVEKADRTILMKPDTANQVWTLRQLGDGERSSLNLSINDRFEGYLTFVRPL